MKDLVELEVRELLEAYGYPDDLPVMKDPQEPRWKKLNLLS